MTQSNTSTELTTLYDLVSCSTCKARPGQPCHGRFPTGREHHLPRQDRAYREYLKLTLPLFDHTDKLAFDYAAAHNVSEDDALHATGLLRAELYRQARNFMREGKMVPPTFEQVRQLIGDEMVAKAFAASSVDHYAAREQINSGVPLGQLVLAGLK
ncbi:hypothetical protein [Mycobacterium sp. 852002-10029_SCH5224772]|uniref:zinc finger domain-containing protein n=1 Tax=Mycobacterium sp. 852002-10029_SCH5224772 TaxID=1834083 RepID=UPI0012E8B1E3|nr:hypothetical protein [Mycobacterium sp. 852002-10029_SCH5224772]